MDATNTKNTHCHCCRPFAGVDHSRCGEVVINAAEMVALNAIKLALPVRKARRLS